MCFPIARYTVQRTTRFLVELSLIKTSKNFTVENSVQFVEQFLFTSVPN